MPEPTNEQVARRYFEANARNDLGVLDSLRSPDWQMRWPSTGELLDSAAYRAVHEHYPGGYPRFDTMRIVGSEDRYVVTPANTVMRIAGSGDVWIGEARMAYGDGTEWYGVKLLELRDVLVHRETDYWSPVTDAPDWRRRLTAPLPRAEP